MMHVVASAARLLVKRSHFAKLRTGGTKPATSPVGSRGVPADAIAAPTKSIVRVEASPTCCPRIYRPHACIWQCGRSSTRSGLVDEGAARGGAVPEAVGRVELAFELVEHCLEFGRLV